MHYFYCSNLFVRMDDVKNVWVDTKLDKIYIKVKSGEIKSCAPNGVQLYEEFKEIKKISDLKSYLFMHSISASVLADQINVSPPAVCTLFTNKRLSPSMEKKIRKKYHKVFQDYDKILNNPLVIDPVNSGEIQRC